MIEEKRIEHIKTNTDLVSLIRSRGVELKKNGKGYRGKCPFHEDNDPSLSVNPEQNLWNCFGCDAGGDAIRFIELYDNVSFNKAVESLTVFSKTPVSTNTNTKTKNSKAERTLPEEQTQQLLQRALAFYERNLGEEAQNYLSERHITDQAFLNRYSIGYSNGKLPDTLPEKGDILEDLGTLGILNENGWERFSSCLVVPVYDMEGNLTSLYGRSIKKGDKRHIFLPNRPTGLWNISIIRNYSEIILVESILDGLSVAMAGFENVISCQGTGGLLENDIRLLEENGVGKITVLFDGDEAGRKGVERLKKKISGIYLDIKTLPDDHDPNSYLVEYGAKQLSGFISRERSESQRQLEPQIQEQSQSQTQKQKQKTSLTASQVQPEGFTVTLGLRCYRIMGLDKGSRKLKATVRLEQGGKIHVDTLDFYSARARRALAQDICRIFNEVPETIEGDITKLMTTCEQTQEMGEQQGLESPSTVEVLGRDKEEAEDFGKSTDLMGAILADFEACGLIGEEANKLLGYLAMTSRKLANPLSMLILSSSGAGKTALQDGITSLCPPEDLVKITSLSGKALFYKDRQSLKNKVLAIEEGDGADDAAYALRSLISNGVLISESTIKDLSTGRLTTMENRVEGPTSVFFTTTNPDTDPETASRFFVVGIDESREQTRKILAMQRKQQMIDSRGFNNLATKIKNKHHNFQRLLQPVGVRNPYGEQLSYDDDRLQGRRDQPKYLQLIKAVAFLRQLQKETKREGESSFIEVDLEDIRIAGKLTGEVLGKSLDELSRPGRDLLMLLDEMVEETAKECLPPMDEHKPDRTNISFTRRDIREFTGWANARVHRYIKELVELEYILVDSGRNGSAYRYRLAYEGQGKEGERFVLGLKDPEELAG